MESGPTAAGPGGQHGGYLLPLKIEMPGIFPAVLQIGPILGVVIGTVDGEHDLPHVTIARSDVRSIFEFEYEFVYVTAGGQDHARLIVG